jgi:glycosyltransferase involved in cell wall biosynthesis
MKEQTVLILDPRGNITSGGSDVIKRHVLYANTLAKKGRDKNLKLKVFSASSSASPKNKIDTLDLNLISKPTFNSYKYARQSAKIIKAQKIDVRLLIAGDPWESYWSAYFLNKFLKSKIPIQIQVHGDIANPLWRKINLKNRFRFWFARKSLRRGVVIRCVSNRQKLNLISAFGLDKSKIVVVPVPIEPTNKLLALSKRPRTIGLIGRIHKDRGIWKFINLIESLNTRDSNFKVLIAGDGPERDKFIFELEKVIQKNRIKYLGQISQGKLRITWKSIGVLVSMAPVESYGRVLRESLLAGVPVWAAPSSGVLDLLDSAESGTVKVLNLIEKDFVIIKEFESLLKVKIGSKFRSKFIKVNNTYAEILAKSWIKTIENSKK